MSRTFVLFMLGATIGALCAQVDTVSVYRKLYELQTADASSLLYSIRRNHPETALDMQPFFSKWQGLPSDPAAKLAELRKR